MPPVDLRIAIKRDNSFGVTAELMAAHKFFNSFSILRQIRLFRLPIYGDKVKEDERCEKRLQIGRVDQRFCYQRFCCLYRLCTLQKSNSVIKSVCGI